MFIRYFSVAPSVIQQDSDTSEKSFQLCPFRQTPAKIWSECLWFNEESQEFMVLCNGQYDLTELCEVGYDRIDFQISSAHSAFLFLEETMVALWFVFPFSTCWKNLCYYLLKPFPSDVWRMCDPFPPCTLPCVLQCQVIFKIQFTYEGNSVEHKPRGKRVPWKGWTFIIQINYVLWLNNLITVLIGFIFIYFKK